jgi:hypothetical protein
MCKNVREWAIFFCILYRYKNMNDIIDGIFIKATFFLVCFQYTKDFTFTAIAGVLFLALGVALHLLVHNKE